MASGYEKAECGQDPNNGWTTPKRRQGRITTAIIWSAAMVGWFFTSPTGSAIRTMIE